MINLSGSNDNDKNMLFVLIIVFFIGGVVGGVSMFKTSPTYDVPYRIKPNSIQIISCSVHLSRLTSDCILSLLLSTIEVRLFIWAGI